jgi:hypothetical protein
LHEGGGTMFCLPGTELIPEWFEYDYRDLSISFWFRKKLPFITLFLTTADRINDKDTNIGFDISCLKLIINGCKCTINSWMGFTIHRDHTYLFDLKLQDKVIWDEVILKREWNHAKLTSEDRGLQSFIKECRLHILEQESSMEDFQFTNPYKKRELYDGIDNVNGDVFYDVDDVLEDDGDVFYDVNDVLEDDVDEENDDDDDHHSK